MTDTFDDIKSTLDDAEEATNEAPRPLTRELPPGEPYPVDALGGILSAAANAIVGIVMVPSAIAAQSVLAASTLAVQSHADVLLPFGEHQYRPLSNYYFTRALSSERKSSTDKYATHPIRVHQHDLIQDYQLRLPGYRNATAADVAARKHIQKSNKGDLLAIRNKLDALGPEPLPPLEPLLLMEEPNYEGMTRQFAFGQPGLGLFSTEGGFIGGYGMQENTILRTATGLSMLWDGEAISRVRGTGTTILHGRRLCMHLMVQPHVADLMFGNELLIDQGLISRCLIVSPVSRIGSRIQPDEMPPPSPALNLYSGHLLRILKMQPRMEPGERNALDPRHLSLSRAAATEWRKFSNHVEAECRLGGEAEPVLAFAGKLAEHAARLAGVLALVADITTEEIRIEQMQAGIVLAEHYLSEALRLEAAGKISSDMQLANELLAWTQKQPPDSNGQRLIALVDVYQRGPRDIREQIVARRIIAILEEHRWLIRIIGGANVGGVKRRDVWRLAEA